MCLGGGIVFLTLVFSVQGTPAEATPGDRKSGMFQTRGTDFEDENNSFIDPRARMQDYLKNLSFYEPIYFLVGVNPEKSKFQLSFKYRLFNPGKSLSRKYHWITGFYLGYTQTSLWDLESDSKPFEDTSYKPELFFSSDNIRVRPSWLTDWIVKTGLKHESNGNGGDASRSTNYIYFETVFVSRLSKDFQLGISPQVWLFYNNDDATNPDIEDYRGYFEIKAGITKKENFALLAAFRQGSAGGTIQVDFSYPLHRLFADNVDFYFYAQYVNGYAETLKNYSEKDDVIRLGIAITR